MSTKEKIIIYVIFLITFCILTFLIGCLIGMNYSDKFWLDISEKLNQLNNKVII